MSTNSVKSQELDSVSCLEPDPAQVSEGPFALCPPCRKLHPSPTLWRFEVSPKLALHQHRLLTATSQAGK